MEMAHRENTGSGAEIARAETAAGLWAEVTELSAEQAPRRFSICQINVDADDGAVLAWGFAFTDGAMLCGPDGTPKGRFPSAESTIRRFRHNGDLRLIWIDPPTP